MKKKTIINKIIKLILGVKISTRNFNARGIVATSIVMIFGYILFVEADFFKIIDTMLVNSEQPWYSFYLAKFSFLMIFVKISSLSLFTRKNKAVWRFIAAFTTQFLGFTGIVIINTVTNLFEETITDPQMKMMVLAMPYGVSLVAFLIIRGIYEVRSFNEKKFFDM